jgi:hypothetical protein
MKTLRWALLWLLFCVLLPQVTPMSLDRHEFAHASVAYSRDPSATNAKELARQQGINESIRLLMSSGLFAVGMLCYGAYRVSLRAFDRRRSTP